ncbi:MAG TPA: phospholipid carrier-dependent glycosyltransferase [Propionicimonas sp.]
MTEAEWGPGRRMAAPPETPDAPPADSALGTLPAAGPRHAALDDPAPVDPADVPPGAQDDADDWDEPEPVAGVSPWRRLRRSVSREDLSTLERLRDGKAELRDRLAGWVVTISITVLAFVIRLVNLGYPNRLVFDETYYPKDGWTLWKFGYEKDWPSTANDSITSGNVNVFKDSAEFVVHPPVGKWLIGFGEQLFGMNSFGWRFMPLVFGSLLVFITIRMARRLSRSTMVGAIAGILITFDGLSFAMSRIGLLDIFQAFFLVAAVSCVVADRDWYRHKLADALEGTGMPDFGGRFGPMIWLRPWRLAAGVMFGLALGTKWNSIFVLAAMGVLSVLWDVGARRLAGSDWRSWFALLADGVPAFVRLVIVSGLVYVVTWSGWLFTSGGYDRQWGANNPDNAWTVHLGPMWASFLKYHQEIYNFHTGDYINTLKPHPYAAPPIGWLVMARPIGIDAVNDIKPGVDGCTATGTDTCIRVISGMGTPILWWMAVIALVVGIIWWLGGRDWRFGVPIVAAMSTYLPWFAPGGRSLFFFYAICIIPFTVTILAMVFGLIIGPADSPNRRRGSIIVGVAVALVVANFAYIYPVLTDELMLYKDWLARMWLRSWI